MEEKKRCSKCKKNKLLDEFYKNKGSKDGHHHYCKLCSGEEHKNRYASSLEYRNRLRMNNLRNFYGLAPDDYTNMLNEQSNKCKICGNKFKSKRQTLIDHNHTTGKVRGLLCPKCNNLLSACNDNVDVLKSAIIYLQ